MACIDFLGDNQTNKKTFFVVSKLQEPRQGNPRDKDLFMFCHIA
jgi:hypothetical protein